jgi:uncharacterized protein (TIGR03067 family)
MVSAHDSSGYRRARGPRRLFVCPDRYRRYPERDPFSLSGEEPMKTRCLALLVVGLLLAADAPKDAKKKDLDKLQGTWTASSVEYNGDKVLGDKEFKVVIEGDKLTVKSEAAEVSKYGTATLKIDPTTTPKIMDVSIIKGDEKGTTFEAIYDVDKDEWKVCLKPFGKERPGKFESKGDSGDVLIVFKREKK